MIREQSKQVLLGIATVAVAKFYFKKDWKTAAIYGAGLIVALALYDTLNPASPAPATA